MICTMYQARRPFRSEFVPIRNLDYHVQVWGEPGPGKTPLVMVHGWMDVAASYQFVVDALQQDRWVIAPDWRGFGQTVDALAHHAALLSSISRCALARAATRGRISRSESMAAL